MEVRTKKFNFRCAICEKPFSKNAYLTRHMVTHTGEKKFECEICGKHFSQNPHLRTHMKMHTSEKTWICSVCGKGFFQKSNLTTHMVTHTGERNHKCDICGKGFSQKTNLNTHMVSHTGGYEFKCDYCEKGFSRFSHLRRHLISHTGEKNFQCNICGKNYTMNSSLERHKLTLHNSTWVEARKKRREAKKLGLNYDIKDGSVSARALNESFDVSPDEDSDCSSSSEPTQGEGEPLVIESDPTLLFEEDNYPSKEQSESDDPNDMYIKEEPCGWDLTKNHAK